MAVTGARAQVLEGSKDEVPEAKVEAGMEPGLKRGVSQDLVSSPKLDRFKIAKQLTDKAIKEKKIFSICGHYPVIRSTLRRKGWVEKKFHFLTSLVPSVDGDGEGVYPHPGLLVPGRCPLSVSSLALESLHPLGSRVFTRPTRSSGHRSVQWMLGGTPRPKPDLTLLLMGPVGALLCPGPSENKHAEGKENQDVALEKADDIHDVMSRLVKNETPYFLWTIKRDVIDYHSLSCDQMLNHYGKTASFTTKIGLCVSMRSLPWYVQANPDTFFPRCYSLCTESEKQEFLDDFRQTVASSILKWVVSQQSSRSKPRSRREEARDSGASRKGVRRSGRRGRGRGSRDAAAALPRPQSPPAEPDGNGTPGSCQRCDPLWD
ncbi:TPA: RGD1306462 protein-like [Bos taurus]|nr:TPA: RGD1306462 protein-like [Bos taurus]